ncbi:MAG TPA: hypothetical protein VGW32_01075, partial [Pyrinomonadaceae bacterium]|nr:hypothetical protein [Pyrinomonadaceae bacterium]
MNEQKQLSILVVASVIFGVLVATVLTISGPKYRAGQTSTNFLTAVLAGTRANSWAQAAEKVKEDRGEPAGKQAKVEIP